MKRTYLALLFLVVVGFFLRMWDVGKDLMHVDEKWTIDLVQHSWSYVVQYTLTQDCNPPLFYLVDKLSIAVWGPTLFGIRFPSLIFGTLLIIATFYLGKEIKNETLGVLAASVVTFLGSMWYYSQFARAYMLVALLMTLTLVFYTRIIRKEWDCQYSSLGFILGALACVYTHLYALIPITLMLVYLLYLYRTRFLIRAGIIVALLFPLVGLGISIINGRTGSVQDAQNWIGNTIPQLLQLMPLEYFGYLCVGVFTLIAYAVFTQCKKNSAVPMIAGIWLVTYIIQLAVSQITPVFVRYSLLLVPSLCVVAMYPLAEHMESDALAAQKWFALAVFYAVFMGVIAYQYMDPNFFLPKGNIPI